MIINGERSLAYIAKITDIQPIPNYDRVELATINDGWRVIISKADHFIIGDWCIYFEIDSKVPEDDERFAFLAKRNFRVKTLKMCGTVSQGLVCPIVNFPEIADKTLGEDVGKILNITYYEVEDNQRKDYSTRSDFQNSLKARHPKLYRTWIVKWLLKREWGRNLLNKLFRNKRKEKRGFPTFVSKTDEERVENCAWVLGDGNDYVLTEKLDGCLDRDVSVVTNSGIFKISEIVNKKMPVQVLSYNTESGRCEYKDIKQYFKWKRVSDMYDVVVKQMGTSGGNREKHIKCTSTHKFFNGTDYTPSCELKAGDMVFHRKETSSEVAKQIALGKLLGDASLSVKHGILNGGFSFNHSIKQKEYFDETVRLLGNDCHKYKNSTSGYGSELLRAHYVSSGDTYEDVCRKCWDGKKKTVTKEWCDCLTPISLAFWYMDDGHIHNADSDNLRPRIYIATNSFSLYECNLLIDALKNKFDIEAKLNTKESYKGNVLSLDTKNTDKFCLLVAPYICEGMKYKLPIRYRNIKYCLSDYVCENGSSIVETTVVRVNKIEDYGRKYVFDLEVEDNHNYFACGVLTHNTSSTYALERKGKKKFEFYVCSRNVRQENENQACYHEYNIYWAMAKKYNIEENLKKYLNANPDIKWVCIQGESVGKVQGNPLKLDEDDLYVFNFITSKDGRWDSRAGKQLVEEWGMKWVPILGVGKTQDNMPDMKKFSHGNSVVNPNVLREGIVYRSLDGQRSFKNVDPEYLLKHNQ